MTRLILGPLIGGLASNRANLWGRTDGPATLHAWIGTNPDLSDAQLAGSSLPLSPENGYAGVAPVGELLPDARYHYALTLTDSPPLPQAGAYPGFTTFPPAESADLSPSPLALASVQRIRTAAGSSPRWTRRGSVSRSASC